MLLAVQYKNSIKLLVSLLPYFNLIPGYRVRGELLIRQNKHKQEVLAICLFWRIRPAPCPGTTQGWCRKSKKPKKLKGP